MAHKVLGALTVVTGQSRGATAEDGRLQTVLAARTEIPGAGSTRRN